MQLFSSIYSLQKGYKSVTILLSSRDNTVKEVSKMFIFKFNSDCGSDCSSIWQILSRFCGFGC